MRFAKKGKQINGEHAEHANVTGDPEPEIRLHLVMIELGRLLADRPPALPCWDVEPLI